MKFPCVLVALFASLSLVADIRVGIIGCDTSHTIAFTEMMNVKKDPICEGARVTVAYQWGSRDIFSSTNRYPKYRKQLGEMDVEIVPSIAALLAKCDAVCLETNDGRPHLEQAKEVFASGKPVFIDKPVAARLADVIKLIDAAKSANAKWFSSSAVRFVENVQKARRGEYGRIRGATTWSPEDFEPHHDMYYWYGIHAAEPLFAVMGRDCESVQCMSDTDGDVLVGRWKDGRIGVMRGLDCGKPGHEYGTIGGTIFTGNKHVDFGEFTGYKPLLKEIVEFFRTGVPPVPAEETLRIYAFMTAAEKSWRQGGAEISLDATIAEASDLPPGGFAVDFGTKVGPIKPMNGVNNGPVRSGATQCRDNFSAYKMAEIPFARNHDANQCSNYGGPHIVDVHVIFPNFDADENDPKNYDFVYTDEYVKNTLDAGTEVFYRLGPSIEFGPKKYGILPPKDNAKWARICEHIIRHYNEGWANGFWYGIRYWEVWCEPDAQLDDWPLERKFMWGGTEAEFMELYVTAVRHLKGCFPKLKIGGPALCYELPWADRFLARLRKENLPLDFFSWHAYEKTPERIAAKSLKVEELLQKHGFGETEHIVDEYNYVRGWGVDWPYTTRAEQGMKGAAFIAATMSLCQDSPVDALMYYDARPCAMNGLFSFDTYDPKPGYWALVAWRNLRRLGTEVKAVRDPWAKDLFATAAVGKDGRKAVLITRFNENDNVTAQTFATLRIRTGETFRNVRCRVMDRCYSFGEAPCEIEDNVLKIKLEPLSFALVEFE